MENKKEKKTMETENKDFVGTHWREKNQGYEFTIIEVYDEKHDIFNTDRGAVKFKSELIEYYTEYKI